MKNTILILLLIFSINILFSQDYTTIEILNIEKEPARIAVNQAFQDLKLPRIHVWNNQTSAESSFYTYTSLLIKSRFIFKVNVEPNVLTVSINNRQYLSKGNWVDNPIPMSKKQAAKILDPLKTKIENILNTFHTKVIIKETKKVIVKHIKGENPEETTPKETTIASQEPIKDSIQEKQTNDNYQPKYPILAEGTPNTSEPNSNDYPQGNVNSVSNLNDKQAIILLASEAMEKIKTIDDKIKGLQSVANETNYLKISAEIQNLRQSIKPIKEECIAKINAIAKKRSIFYSIKKTDPARYYSISGLKVYGSHWERPTITVLVEVMLNRHRSTKTINDNYSEPKTFLEELGELRFQFHYNNEPLSSNHTIPVFNKKNISSFGISFENFERETKFVDFKSSNSKTTLLK